MKKIICVATILFSLSAAGLVFAAQEQKAPAATVPTATNLAAGYPTAKEKLPPVPVPPASLQDAKATAAYIAAMDAYLKATQSYIDAATNDANRVIEERNTAIQGANQVVANYNAFFKIDEKK